MTENSCDLLQCIMVGHISLGKGHFRPFLPWSRWSPGPRGWSRGSSIAMWLEVWNSGELPKCGSALCFKLQDADDPCPGSRPRKRIPLPSPPPLGASPHRLLSSLPLAVCLQCTSLHIARPIAITAHAQPPPRTSRGSWTTSGCKTCNDS